MLIHRQNFISLINELVYRLVEVLRDLKINVKLIAFGELLAAINIVPKTSIHD